MKTLHLTVTREWFLKILSGEKIEDFREIKPHWDKRLTIRDDSPHPRDTIFKEYDLIKIVNGYGADCPTIVATFGGVRITGKEEVTDLGRGEFYAIKIGKRREIKNIVPIDPLISTPWHLLTPSQQAQYKAIDSAERFALLATKKLKELTKGLPKCNS